MPERHHPKGTEEYEKEKEKIAPELVFRHMNVDIDDAVSRSIWDLKCACALEASPSMMSAFDFASRAVCMCVCALPTFSSHMMTENCMHLATHGSRHTPLVR